MPTPREAPAMPAPPEAPAMPAPPEASAMPTPGISEPGAVPSVPFHGPADGTDDSLDGLAAAFNGFSFGDVEVDSVKRKKGKEKDARGGMADEGVGHGRDPALHATSTTREPPFEGAPSAFGHHASPSATTTTLPVPDTAATSSTPMTIPPTAERAEGTGFTGMPAPTYPAYGVDPSTAEGTSFTNMPTPAYPADGIKTSATALSSRVTASEPRASSSMPHGYCSAVPHHHHHHSHHHDFPGYTTLTGLRRGPPSCGSKSGGSRGSSNRSVTRSELREALRGATADLVGDITQEIRAKLEPLFRPMAQLLPWDPLPIACKRTIWWLG